MRVAVEQALTQYTRIELNEVLREELKLAWPNPDIDPSTPEWSKRDVVREYTEGWELPALAELARRIVSELDIVAPDLLPLLDQYDRGGGVGSPAKNLIFAANGPKPELVLRDAVSNDIQIVRNARYCLVYEKDIAAEGLRYQDLVDWWREKQQAPQTVPDREVGLALHERLRASLDGNGAEEKVLEAYARRYKTQTFSIPALIPQVYLHCDPYTQRSRSLAGRDGSTLPRQRMDFLLLFSTRHRVVIEVDGKQHYARGDRAEPNLYAEMVAEDRRLRLTGYEVYRFGGAELARPGADAMLDEFFDQLAERMT